MLDDHPRNSREYDRLDLNDSLMGEDAMVGAEDDFFPLDPADERADAFPPTADVGSMDEEDSSSNHPYRRSPLHDSHPFPMNNDFPGSVPRSASKHREAKNFSRGGPYLPPYPHGGHPLQYYNGPPYPSNRTTSGNQRNSNSNQSPYHHYQGYILGYSPYHRHQGERYPWPPPPPAGTTMAPPYDSDEEPIPPPPLAKKRSYSPNRPGQSTPEQLSKSRSPFRSPPSGSTSKRNYRPSPIFQGSPTQLGTCGSFEFETPSGILGAGVFSPMGPSFDGTEEFPAHGDGFSGSRWNMSRSLSQDSESSSIAPGRSRRQLEPSPLTGYMNDTSPIGPSLLRSLIPSSGTYGYEAPSDSNSKSKPGEVTVSDRRGEPPSSRLDPDAQPKQLWPRTENQPTSKVSPSNTPGPVRLEIGGGSASRNKLDGINSMMHSSRRDRPILEQKGAVFGLSPRRRDMPPPPTGIAQHHRLMHPPYGRMELETPIKQHFQRPPPPGGHHLQIPPPQLHGSGQKPMYPPSAMKAEYHDGPRANEPMYMSHPDIVPPLLAMQSPGGKENSRKLPGKRSPCNCKKSRCLKLYCDCFASEQFCQGCNCVDCQNTPETSSIRDKAIKDTRAKNNKAFLSRIVVKDLQDGGAPQKIHQMGCKCKKTECLKKYCEVRLK
jgi:hypothetical protein